MAQTLAETLIEATPEDTSNNADTPSAVVPQTVNTTDNTQMTTAIDDEWQITFVQNPEIPDEDIIDTDIINQTEISSKLERRLSLRPSKQQIETWGFVPPQYFESPVKICLLL